MGLEIVVPSADTRLDEIVARARGLGVEAIVAMIDGMLVAPGKPLPAAWRDARVRTPAGTVTLVRRGDAVAVVVFGNADEALRAAQRDLARALAPA